MSRAPYVMSKSAAAFARDVQMYDTTIGWRFVNPLLKQQYGVDSMPETGENVAAGIQRVARRTRTASRCAASSARWPRRLRAASRRRSSPSPVPAKRGEPTLVSVDEHPRETSLEALAKLPTPFRAGGTVTAGNSSGVNDGACAFCWRRAARSSASASLPRARVVGTAVAGVRAADHGHGPGRRHAQAPRAARHPARARSISSSSMKPLLRRRSPCCAIWALPDDAAHVNPQGGAIALGHPLGASGARLATTALYQLERTRRAARAVHDVHRRRAGHRHADRAHLT